MIPEISLPFLQESYSILGHMNSVHVCMYMCVCMYIRKVSVYTGQHKQNKCIKVSMNIVGLEPAISADERSK
jgi:hypothetical protein